METGSAFLLDEGDELHISDTVTLTFHSKHAVQEVNLTPTQEQEKAVFSDRYLLTGRLLGEGGYGKVLVGIQQESQRQVACKMVRIDHLYNKLAVPNLRRPTGGRESRPRNSRQRWPTKVANCFREFDILKDISHPNIIALEKVFWSQDTIYIFQELVTGGDLFSYLEYNNGRLTSFLSAVTIYQVLKGVAYLHDQEIVHRDLKPDNILMTSLGNDARAVITDFGNARYLPTESSNNELAAKKRQRMFSYVGTLEYAAPEIHRANRAIPAEQGYSKSVDMWSIGSITATIVSGDVIFVDRSHPKYEIDPRAVIVGLAAICDLSILDDEYHPVWSTTDDGPKDFIRRLLVLEEDARMTATEALEHYWFSAYQKNFENLYSRSTKDWQPRERHVQLVERIPFDMHKIPIKRLDDQRFERTGLPMVKSATPYSEPTLFRKLTSSHQWRTNTPLPSIIDDYEASQFASQVQPSSSAPRYLGVQDTFAQKSGSEVQCGQQPHGAWPQDLQALDANLCRVHRTNFAKSPRCSLERQHAPKSADASGMYNEDGINVSRESCESFNCVMDNYPPKGCRAGLQHSASQAYEESIQVDETPLDEQHELGITYQQGEKRHYQNQCLEVAETQQSQTKDQGSLIVYETPPEIFRKQPTHVSVFPGVAGTDQFGGKRCDHTRSKRRRLSRCCA